MSASQKKVNDIFKTINSLCWTDQWDEIDNILMNHHMEEASLEEIIAYLSITLCAKDKLKQRASYLENAKRLYSNHPKFTELFRGL